MATVALQKRTVIFENSQAMNEYETNVASLCYTGEIIAESQVYISNIVAGSLNYEYQGYPITSLATAANDGSIVTQLNNVIAKYSLTNVLVWVESVTFGS